MKRRAWLKPLLWLLVAALAAVAPWAWRRWHAPPRPPRRVLPLLALSGDMHGDQVAILERAAQWLLPSGRPTAYPEEAPVDRAALMGELGLELLSVDPPRGQEVVQRAIEMATRPADRVTRDDLDAPERTRIGMLVHLAHSLRQYPELAERALRTAYEEAQGGRDLANQVYALSLFAREAADIDPARAQAAVRKARGVLLPFPVTTSADPFAAVASAVARLDGRAAARPLVQRALIAIPSTPARPLIEARLAARLAAAAPDRARDLAHQALADIQSQVFRYSGIQVFRERQRKGRVPEHLNTRTPEYLNARTPEHLKARQLHDVAVILAVTHPDVAMAAARRIVDPAERAAALTEMGAAVEAHAPARAGAIYRLALQEAAAMPDRQARSVAVIHAAQGLAAYDLTAARGAISSLPGPVPVVDMMMLAVRAVKREPEAARRLIERIREGDPAGVRTLEGGDDVLLARVTAEPDLKRALAMAQQGQNPGLQAAALLTVARRLKSSRPAPAKE